VNKHRQWLPAISDLVVIQRRSSAGIALDADDLAIVHELVDGILADQDVREKYWQSVAHRPEKDWPTKLAALVTIAETCTAEKPPNAAMFEQLANETGLSFEAIEGAYRKYLRPHNLPPSKK
jgi:hypothetical protein